MASGASLLASYPLHSPSSDEYPYLGVFSMCQSSRRCAPSRLPSLSMKTAEAELYMCMSFRPTVAMLTTVRMGFSILIVATVVIHAELQSCVQVLNRIAPAQTLPI